MASAPRPPVTRSRTAAGDIFTASDPTGPTLRFPNQPGGPRTGAPPGLREDVQMSQDAVDDLVKLLDLEPIELNIFRGISPDEDRQRVFGGQVAGQALVAAARTVEPGRDVHSLHAYFLRPGDLRVPILYQVDRIRDGRSFSTRRVVAVQHGKAIFNLQASFQVPEEGLEHQAPMPEATPRSEVRRVGNESGKQWRSRGSLNNYKKK